MHEKAIEFLDKLKMLCKFQTGFNQKKIILPTFSFLIGLTKYQDFLIMVF